MRLLMEVNDEVEDVEQTADPKDVEGHGPAIPDGWTVGHLANHGMIISCDGFQLKMDINELNKLFDIAEDGEPGEIRDQNGKIVLVEPTDDSIVLTRAGDETYPEGVELDLGTLKEMGIEQHDTDPDDQGEEQPDDVTINPSDEQVDEGIHRAYRRYGSTIKRGFRVTSGYRKGRVVANIKTAYKPKPKASTRMKLSIAGRRKRVIRVLKAKRTRRKSISKRLARLNKGK
jgi:hypothetical protein